jgi:hypothetical protein
VGDLHRLDEDQLSLHEIEVIVRLETIERQLELIGDVLTKVVAFAADVEGLLRRLGSMNLPPFVRRALGIDS